MNQLPVFDEGWNWFAALYLIWTLFFELRLPVKVYNSFTCNGYSIYCIYIHACKLYIQYAYIDCIWLYILWNLRSPNWFIHVSTETRPLQHPGPTQTNSSVPNYLFKNIQKQHVQPVFSQHESSLEMAAIYQLIPPCLRPPFWRRKCTSSGAEMRFLEISKISSVGQPHSDTRCRVHVLPWSSQVRKCIDHLMILLRCIPVPPTPTKKNGQSCALCNLCMWICISYVYMLHIYRYINYLHLLQSTPKYVPLKPSESAHCDPTKPRHDCGPHRWTVLLEAPWKKFIGLTPTFKWMSPRK